MPKRLTIVIIFCWCSLYVKPQSIGDSIVDRRFANAVEVYVSSLGDQSPLYNGKEYIDNPISFREGHPFFESREFIKGQIQFDELTFNEVPLLYDLIKDQLITYDIRKAYKVILPANKIIQFNLAGHTFVRIDHNDSNRIKTGFYDQLYKGKVSLYAKREKKIAEVRDSYSVQYAIQSQNAYYIFKDGVYNTVKNKNDFMEILKDRKKEMQQFFKQNKLRFKDDPEKAMIMAIEYYNR